MLFTQNAKNNIAKVFYDKTISILTATDTIDAEGGLVKTTSAVASTFKGNVRFNQLGELKNEIGLVKNIDIAISCPSDTQVNLNDILSYDGVNYLVTDCIPYDSHKLVTGEKWQ